jgi:hypothetical protein
MKTFFSIVICMLVSFQILAQNQPKVIVHGTINNDYELRREPYLDVEPIKEEPEFVVNGLARIIMNSGEELSGTAKFSFAKSTSIYFTKPGQKRKRIKARNVREFFINEYHFVNIKTSSSSLETDIAILKTPADSKIRIYEIITQPSVFKLVEGEKIYETHRSFYIKFPHQISVLDMNELTSSFHKKVSQLVYDCPGLSEKIENKEYKVTQVSTLSENLEVFHRIAREYQNCIE